jgi:hypothetical protein
MQKIRRAILDKPVDRLWPELADRKVLERIDGHSMTRSRPAGSITTRERLT